MAQYTYQEADYAAEASIISELGNSIHFDYAFYY